MRAGADAGIFAVAPIDEVVAALAAGAGVVRDFVGRQPARLGHFPRRLEQGEAQILVRQLELAGVAQAFENRVRLDGQLIERDVVAGIVERLGELAAPFRFALPRPAVNEIEAEARKQRSGELDRGQRLGGRMLASERLEIGVVQRLDADRQAIDAG